MKLLLDRKGRKYLVNDGDDLHTNYGCVDGKAISSAQAAGLIKSNTNQCFTVLDPNIIDFIEKAKRGPQAMTLKDMSLAVGYSGIHSGSRVLEAGAGSGLFTIYLSHIVYPEVVVSYEIRKDFAKIARKNFERFGVKNVDLKLQDIFDGISESGFDAVFLDLTEPWRVIPRLKEALNVGGVIVSYSPSINQSRQLVDVLSDYNHETFECILRNWKPETMCPNTRMLGHTGFLTVARKLA